MLAIKYIVPEDGDELKHPNVFFIENIDIVTLDELKNAFPLVGNFFFRFLKNINNIQVWLDVTEGTAILPVSSNGIFIKATRIAGLQSSQKGTLEESGAHLTFVNSIPIKSVEKPKTVLSKNQSEKLIKFDEFEPLSHSGDDFPSLIEDNDLLGISSNPITANINGSGVASSDSDLFGLQHIQPDKKPVSAMNPPPSPVLSVSSNRGMSPMGGGMSAHHSPSSSMNNFQSQSQQQQQQQRGGGMHGSMASGGVGMNPMMGGTINSGSSGNGGGMYDPFNNISGLHQQARGGQSQQSSFNPNTTGNTQNGRSSSNNRGTGRGF